MGVIDKSFMNEKGKVEFSKLSYNLNDLFNNTPLFNEPPLDFDGESEEESEGHNRSFAPI